MTLKEAIEVLRMHNRWRRGDDSIPMTNPTKLGLAIDTIVFTHEDGFFSEYNIAERLIQYETELTQTFNSESPLPWESLQELKDKQKEDILRQSLGIAGIIEEALVQISVSSIFIGHVNMDAEHKIKLANIRYELLNQLSRVHEYFNSIVLLVDEEYDTNKKI